MSLVVIIFLGPALLLLAIQALLVSLFARAIRKSSVCEPDETPLPQVSVILCVRGADPSLEPCLLGLADQDYPHWQLLIVADHPSDPALELAARVLPASLQTRTRQVILSSSQRLSTCSLKCSGIIAACGELPSETEVVALLDADTLPPRDWLRRMVVPFQDDAVGVTTALRWYSPADSHWGTHVRYVWNAAAIVQMWFYRIPWGGSLAIRRSLLRSAGLLETWKTTFCEDTPLQEALRHAGARIEVVVNLVMDNHESCGLPDVTRWIRRQLLTARLHHRAWFNVLGHALLTSISLLGLVGCGIAGLLWRDFTAVAASMGGLLAYEIGMVALVAWIHAAVAKGSASRSGDPLLPRPGLWRTAADIGLSQLIYPWAAIGAQLTRQVSWRRVTYAVGPRCKIERLDYAPFSTDASPPSNHSL